MRPAPLLFALFALFACCAPLSPAAENQPEIQWLPWSDEIFAQARKEQKLVLLDLGAGWCHWCHVMDAQTYADAEVIKLLCTNGRCSPPVRTPEQLAQKLAAALAAPAR